MSKAPRGDRSFQPGAGKGDSDRVTDVQAFRNNYDQIDWGRRLKRAVVPIFYKKAWPANEQVTDDAYRRGDWENAF